MTGAYDEVVCGCTMRFAITSGGAWFAHSRSCKHWQESTLAKEPPKPSPLWVSRAEFERMRIDVATLADVIGFALELGRPNGAFTDEISVWQHRLQRIVENR